MTTVRKIAAALTICIGCALFLIALRLDFPFTDGDGGFASPGMILELIPPGEEIPISDFVERLAKRAPVIDGGVYRRQVEARILPGKWSKPLDDALSSSLSRMLLRLREAHVIDLRRKSDFGKVIRLIGREGREIQSVTHVARRNAP